ncbi:MAG: hypothetical protein ACRDQ4_24115 [Pseudonocardiaceae bacterium]
MSSTVVRKRLEESDESSDDSRWIIPDDAPLANWADSGVWLNIADEHVDSVSDTGVVVPISRRRAGLHGSRDHDSMDEHSDESDAPLENYESWESVKATITYGSGIRRPIAEVSDDELLW